MKKMKAAILIVLCVVSSYTSAADIKRSMALRTAQVNTIEPRVGPRPILRLCGGAMPQTVSAPDGGIAYVKIQLPDDWATTATAGVISNTDWKAATVKANGQATHYRLYSEDGTTHIQGRLGLTAGSGILQIPDLNLGKGRVLKINSWTISAGGDGLPAPLAANRTQYSIAIQNDWMGRIELIFGAGSFAKLITGALPASTAASDPGVTVATMPLAADWLSTPSSGIVSTLSALLDASADATGVPTHARLQDALGTTHLQLDVTNNAGAGIIKLSNTSVVAGDNVSVSPFQLTAGNQ